MSFVRPAARDALWRWRETLLGAGMVALGAWWFAGSGILSWVGLAVLLAGAGLGLAGVQRGRFRTPPTGPGLVQIDEGRITYFGPLTGGSADLADLTRLDLDGGAYPPHWVLYQPARPPLRIPISAAGAEALFDAFARLPGLRTGRLIAALRRPKRETRTLWDNNANGLH